MIGLLEWLLDLERIRLGRDAPLSVHWQPLLPVWLVTPLTLLGLVVVLIAYRRERCSAAGRSMLFVARASLILLLAVLLGRPALVLQRERVESSHVALLFDTSRSMLIADGCGGDSRMKCAQQILSEKDGAAIAAMLSRNDLVVHSFAGSKRRELDGDSVEDIPLISAAIDGWPCEGSVSDPWGALESVLAQRDGGRLSAVVIVSDGRATVARGMESAIEKATARQVPIFVLPVGSESPLLDAVIVQVTAPSRAFLKDRSAVRVEIRVDGSAAEQPVKVRLLNESSGEEMARRVVTISEDGKANIVFAIVPGATGRLAMRVEIEELKGERALDNNVARVGIDVVDDVIRVLYVDGQPRYEYRYLKNTLLREPTMRSSCLLLSADEAFVQEGTDPLRRFPTDIEALSAYDVVLLGDVDPNGAWLSTLQAEMLVEYVSERGGGFGLLAGPRFAPHRFAGSPLARLLPIRIDENSATFEGATITQSYVPKFTPEGRTSGLFPLNADDDWDALGGLYWFAATAGAKPGAEVLAYHPGLDRGEAQPLFVLGRVGAGRVFFSGTDETWRWRRSAGEWAFDAFWTQVCRTLARTESIGIDRRYEIFTDRRRYGYGQVVEIRLRVFDSEMLSATGDTVRAIIKNEAGQVIARLPLLRTGFEAADFDARFTPPADGWYSVEIGGVMNQPDVQPASARFFVGGADPESSQPGADHESLRRIAAATGGEVLTRETVANSLAGIVDRSLRIPDDVSEPLWDSKLSLILFATLISAEWIVRKAMGLV